MDSSRSQLKIAWKPTPKQIEFLAAPEEEVLFGGSAGGGKTAGMLVDSLGGWQDAISYPDYRGLLLRKTFKELRNVIDESHVIYPLADPKAKFNSTDKEWRFSSGAKIYLGYAENENDKYQFQGLPFQYVCFEELTQWPTDSIYKYLFSRLRTSNPNLKCLMRATCNPGGVGHKWVQERWGLSGNGAPTRFATKVQIQLENGEIVERVIHRRFIPARLGDNPHLPIEYRANLMQLDDVERAQLLDGRWDVIDIPGQIYRTEMMAATSENRLTRVPYDSRLPVHTAWDIGVRDSTTIVMWQQNNREVWVIDYYEASGEGLAHYAQVLQSRGYVWGTHWAPHDIQVRELGSGKSRIETAAMLGIKFQIVPQIGVEDGIHAARALFPRIWFDEKKTTRLLDCLRHYRRDYNSALGEFKTTPVHDWASHGADAFRYMAVAMNDKAPREKKAGSNYGGGGWLG